MSSEAMKDFNGKLRQAIDETIFSILGQYYEYSLRAEELSSRLDTLMEVLEYTFGPPGARTIGRAIAKRLYWKLGIQFLPRDEYTFQDYVEEAKKKLVILN